MAHILYYKIDQINYKNIFIGVTESPTLHVCYEVLINFY